MFGTAKIPQLMAAVAANGFDEVAHMELGKNYLAEGRYMQAVAEFRRMVEINPDYVESWRLLGQAYDKALIPKEAASAYRHGLRLAEKLGLTRETGEMKKLLADVDKDLAPSK